MSTAVRTSAFSFVGALNVLLYIPYIQHLPSWSCVSNLQLVGLVGRVWVFFLSHTAPGFQLWFSFHLCMWLVLRGLLLGLPWRTRVCPSEAQVWRWCSCLGCRGSGSTRSSGGWQLGQQEIQCSRRVWQPVLANTLQCSCLENPPTEKPGRPQSTGSQRVGHEAPLRTQMQDFFLPVSAPPQWDWAWRWHSRLACGDPGGAEHAGTQTASATGAVALSESFFRAPYSW